MDMAVDSPGQDQKARSVDLGRGARQVVRQHGDAAVLHADVAFADVGGGDDGPAANDEIKLHSPRLRFSPALASRRGDAKFMQQDPCKLRRWRSGLQNDAQLGLTLEAVIVGFIRPRPERTRAKCGTSIITDAAPSIP